MRVGGFFEGNVFVVAGGRFCRGREDRLGKLRGFDQACRQRDAADAAGPLVVLPAGAGKIAAHDTFDGDRLGAFYEHGAARQFGRVRREVAGEVGGGDDVIRNDAVQLVEPEKRKLREDFALVRESAWGERRRRPRGGRWLRLKDFRRLRRCRGLFRGRGVSVRRKTFLKLLLPFVMTPR